MKKCILYDGRICNDCGECNRCDLDPDKICDSCGKCISGNPLDEFRSINVVREKDEAQPFDNDGMMAFLDEPIELGNPEPIDVDPELAAEWERILAESFEKDREAEKSDEPMLHAIRKRCDRKAQREELGK